MPSLTKLELAKAIARMVGTIRNQSLDPKDSLIA
jgi:hypothetical protein